MVLPHWPILKKSRRSLLMSRSHSRTNSIISRLHYQNIPLIKGRKLRRRKMIIRAKMGSLHLIQQLIRQRKCLNLTISPKHNFNSKTTGQVFVINLYRPSHWMASYMWTGSFRYLSLRGERCTMACPSVWRMAWRMNSDIQRISFGTIRETWFH